MRSTSTAARLRRIFLAEARRTTDPLVRRWLLHLAKGDGAAFGAPPRAEKLEDRMPPPVSRKARGRVAGNGTMT
jgi:hypothetical protein